MEVFLKEFRLLTEDEENSMCQKPIFSRMVFNTNYPLRIFCNKGFRHVLFEPITIFYGGNGSGKTTLLNIIADKIKAERKNIENRGELFSQYVIGTKVKWNNRESLSEIKFISSDDIFDYLLDVRAINSGTNRRKEELIKEHVNFKYGKNKKIRNALEDYEELKKQNDARAKTSREYMRSQLRNNNILQFSNGESALDFWQAEIDRDGIYILDEPENSLSAENIFKLKKFIEESSRFFNCQFIISTHSPFLLALDNAKIYDLDENPVIDKPWNKLKNIQIYYDFFKEHEKLFL
ncbi:MAG: AAA family ATPase [Clostridia bacterium]|nr:AAA family ATPase [Clostridia bacterium]